MNNNKIALTREELIYFEQNELACARALKEKKIAQEKGQWYKFSPEILIPKEHLAAVDEVFITFDYNGFIKHHGSKMTEDEVSMVLGHNLISSENRFAKSLKKKAYEIILKVQDRIDQEQAEK